MFNGALHLAKVYDEKEPNKIENAFKNLLKKTQREEEDEASDGGYKEKEAVSKPDEEEIAKIAKAEEKEKKLRDIANNSGLEWWVKPKDMKTPPDA